jgi:hypothetical protein
MEKKSRREEEKRELNSKITRFPRTKSVTIYPVRGISTSPRLSRSVCLTLSFLFSQASLLAVLAGNIPNIRFTPGQPSGHAVRNGCFRST